MLEIIAIIFVICFVGFFILTITYTDYKINMVFFEPANPDNDEAEIRWMLFKYPKAVIIVPKSKINYILSSDNTRIIVQ